MKLRRIAGVVLVVVLAGMLYHGCSPAAGLRRKSTKLLDSLSFAAGSEKVARQLALSTAGELIADELVVEVAEGARSFPDGTFDKEDVLAGFQYLAESARSTRFVPAEFRSVKVGGGRGEVLVRFPTHVDARVAEAVDGECDAVLYWERGERGWKLGRVRIEAHRRGGADE